MAVDKYEPTYDFSSDLGDTHGLRLDIEFANVSQTTGELSDSLNLIQRSDGKIRDSAVDVHTLSRDVMNLIGGYRTRGGWTSATAYAVNDVVDDAGYVYICKTAHTSSGSFLSDAANWVKFGFGPSTLAQATADSAVSQIAAHLALATGAHDASEIAYAGGTSLPASSVEAAIDSLDNNKAPLASPAFTGTPTAPTAAPGSASSQVANTAFVASAIAAAGSGGAAVVTSFNTRTGSVSLASGDVTGALGYTPLAPGGAYVSSFNGRNGAVSLGSGDVTGALGYVPAAKNSSFVYDLLWSGGIGGGNTPNLRDNWGYGVYLITHTSGGACICIPTSTNSSAVVGLENGAAAYGVFSYTAVTGNNMGGTFYVFKLRKD